MGVIWMFMCGVEVGREKVSMRDVVNVHQGNGFRCVSMNVSVDGT